MEAGIERGGEMFGHRHPHPGTAQQEPVQTRDHGRAHQLARETLADGIAAPQDRQPREVGQRGLLQPMTDPRAQPGGEAIDRLTGGEMALHHGAALGHALQRLGRQ
jgi:hypothetical protein